MIAVWNNFMDLTALLLARGANFEENEVWRSTGKNHSLMRNSKSKERKREKGKSRKTQSQKTNAEKGRGKQDMSKRDKTRK